jgi:hypothetical protein
MIKLIAAICLMSISLSAAAEYDPHYCYSDLLRDSLNERLQIPPSKENVTFTGTTADGNACQVDVNQYKKDGLTVFALELTTGDQKKITTNFLVPSGVYAVASRYRGGGTNLEYLKITDSDLYVTLAVKVCTNDYYFLNCNTHIARLVVSKSKGRKWITLVNSIDDYPVYLTKKTVSCFIK